MSVEYFICDIHEKQGKSNYMKAVSYRPITLSSYIGKLLERILERRIQQHCDLNKILDNEQEGFRATRNTTRYLYILVANLKEAHKMKFTTFLICIDFEKAFYIIWLKGFIVKLYNWNINGKILRLINAFLFSRKVSLIINKTQGPMRDCGEFGVPQGSVLSPLFKWSSSSAKTYASTFKYADDE